MWQYTTETIINSNEGNLLGGVRFGVFGENGGAIVQKTGNGPAATGDFLLIDGVDTFKVENISAVTHAPFIAEQREQVKLDLNTKLESAVNIKGTSVNVLTQGNVLRLKIVLKEVGRVSSIMQDAMRQHLKPFFYEVELTSTSAGDLVDALVNLIKKDLAQTDFKFFKASKQATNQLVLEALDPYIRFESVTLDLIDSQAGGVPQLGADTYVSVLKSGALTVVQAGTEGLGNARQLVKNNRIPTHASTNPFGADHGGKPIPGAEYDQFVIEYCTDRRHVGHQVMGALDKSLTTHVFWVKSNGGCSCDDPAIPTPAEAFAEVLATAVGEDNIKDAKAPGDNPEYPTIQNIAADKAEARLAALEKGSGD